MKHIVSFSGGKDSTAMLLRLLEEGKAVDEIIFCDVGKDFPDMMNHVDKVNKYIKEKYNKEIITIKGNKSFDYYMFEHVKTKGKSKGQKGYGWANMRVRWCTSNLKSNVINNYLKQYKDEGYIEYIGIAVDEPKRIKDKCYPLVEWGMTEKDCLRYCYDRGFDWNGLYEHFDRVSCWCCPLKNLRELKTLYIHYPELWRRLKDMDDRAYNQFRRDYSVRDLEDKFRYSELIKKEKEQGLTDEEYEELKELEFESQREDEQRMAWQEV